MCFSNLKITKIQLKNSEMPVSRNIWLEEELNLIGHRLLPDFSEQRGTPNAYVYNPNFQSNQNEAQNLQPELFRGKGDVENFHKHF